MNLREIVTIKPDPRRIGIRGVAIMLLICEVNESSDIMNCSKTFSFNNLYIITLICNK